MKTPCLTVVLPVFNVEPYIGQCLESIAAQTWGDMEILCIDDCGKDHSIEVAREFANRDQRFKVIRLERHMGAGDSRNVGIDHARGRFIAFVDPDDWVIPDKFAKELDVIEKYELDSVWSKYFTFFEGNGLQQDVRGWNSPEGGGGPIAIDSSILIKSPPAPWNKLYRTDFIRKYNISFTKRVRHQDLGFYFKFYCFSPATYLLDEYLYVYRRREGSVTTNRDMGTVGCHDILDVLLDCFEFMKSGNLFHPCGETFITLFSHHIAPYLFSRHYKKEMIAATKEVLKAIQYPGDFGEIRSPLLDAVHGCNFHESRTKWYTLLKALNGANPHPASREKWSAWIKVNCLAR